MLSMGYKFETRGAQVAVMPCCVWPIHPIPILDKNALDSWRAEINNVDAESDPLCQVCQDRKTSPYTRRRVGFEHIKINEDSQVGDPGWIEIQADVTCNGGCIICGPEYSSYWQHELNDFKYKLREKSQYLAKINTLIDFQKVQNVLILGGEPMLSDIDVQLLDYIEDPSRVHLRITTNGSIYPSDQRMKVWEKFGKITLQFSVDGIGDKFEYLRYPLKWNIVEENILKLQQELPPNAKCNVHHVLSQLNLFYFDEIESWFKNNLEGRYNRDWALNVTPAYGTYYPLSVTRMLKKLIYKKFTESSYPAEVILNDDRSDSAVRDALEVLDKRRNLNWKSVFPEIANAI